MSEHKVVTRFAPSPTGLLHLGTYRTAIFAYLFARKHQGEFVLRIEDTDKERSKKEYEENIISSLKWLGISYDRFYRQSENLSRHTFYLQKMISEGTAYISKEEAKDGSGVIKEIVRFKNPNTVVSFVDEIKGLVTMDTTDLGDFVIAKNINEPLFHLAVVVDDFEEGITHIIRGDDHVSNTPRQILIQKAIGAPTPVYAHIPLVLGEDRQKLSKRKGALAVSQYIEKGFLPDAILNGVAFIGWNPGTEEEVFSHTDLISAFDLKKVQKSPAIFNEVKLRWFNKEHLKTLPPNTLKKEILHRLPHAFSSHKDVVEKILPLIIERIDIFSDISLMVSQGELDFFFDTPFYEKELLLCPQKLRKDTEVSFDTLKEHIETLAFCIEKIDGEWTLDAVKNSVWDYATEKGRGIVLWAMRVALSGKEKSPDPFQISAIIGKDETLSRLTYASKLL